MGLTHSPKRAITHYSDIHIHTSGWTHIHLCCSAFPHAPVTTAWSIITRHRHWISSQLLVSQTPSSQHLTDTLQLQRDSPSLTSPHSKSRGVGKGAQRLFTTTTARSSESPLTVQPQQNLFSYRYCMLKSHRNLTKWLGHFSVTASILILPG